METFYRMIFKMENIIYRIVMMLFLITSTNLFFCNCSSEKRRVQEIKKLYNKSLDLTSGYEIYPSSEYGYVLKLRDSLKVITYMDEPPCTECIVKLLAERKRIIEKMKKDIP